jgi:hypothetical protein
VETLAASVLTPEKKSPSPNHGLDPGRSPK